MSIRDFLERTIQIGISLILILAPIPFGSVQERWIFVIEAGACCLMLLWVGDQLAIGHINLVKAKLFWPLLAVIAYLVMTLLPLNAGILRLVSPETFRLYQSAGHALSGAGSALHPVFRITLSPFETEGEILKLAGYAAFFFLALYALRHRQAFLAVYYLLITLGTAVALLGIAQSVWSNGKIYWRYESGSGAPFGPFVNHNHFAGYMELALGLCLGMLLAQIREFRRTIRPGRIAGYFAWLWHREGAGPWLLFFSFFAMLSALAASLSRGGIASFIITCLLFSLGALASAREPRGPRHSMVQMKYRRILVIASLGALLLWVGLMALTPRGRARWENVFDTAASYRLQILRDGVRALSDFPYTGAGLGSFRSVYPRYKSGTFTSETTYAENEYLQWAMETGVAGVSLMLLLVLAFARQVVSRLRTRRDSYFRCLTYGALFSMTSLGIHNWIDFNTHIPSNALTLAAVAALCLLAVNFHRGVHGYRFLFEVSRIPLRSTRGIALLAGIVVAAGIVGQRAWVRYQGLRLQAQWTNDRPYADNTREPELALLRAAVSWSPANDRAHYLQAAALESGASAKSLFEFAGRRRMLERANREILEAVRLQPAEASYWAMLGRIAAGMQNFELSDQAFKQALMLARTEGFIHRDYGVSLLLRGEIEAGTAQLVIARNYAPHINLQELLEFLSTRTNDRKVWESIVRYRPDDLKTYAGFLRGRGLTNLGDQIWNEAEVLEKRK